MDERLGWRNLLCQTILCLWLASKLIDGQSTEFAKCLDGDTEFIAMTVGARFKIAKNQCAIRDATQR